jgi:hypothetical protein
MTKTRDLANLIADSKIGPTEIDTSGTYTVGGIVTSGNVDGRDVSVDGTKLDGIEASADVTDATNVTAAGALMDSEVTNLAAVKALNQGLATTDEPTFRDGNLAALSAVQGSGATHVDVFVYDTSKDSDGGAWRHRTKDKSWYNESSGAKRGSRKEFPAVAIIAITNTLLTIYDADDPDISMWMIFDCTSKDMLGGEHASGGSWLTKVKALNGELFISSLSGYSPYLFAINFINEKGRMWDMANGQYCYNGNIAQRNDALSMYVHDSVAKLTWIYLNDVDVKVFPNAPTDPSTGLPIPTIAICFEKGFDIIHPDNTVVNKGTTAAIGSFSRFLGNNLVGVAPLYYGIYKDIHLEESASYLGNTSDANYYWADDASPLGSGAYNFPRPLGNVDKLITIEPRTIVTSTTAQTVNSVIGRAGLNIHELGEGDITDNSHGMAAYVTSDYNTGWMPGDIKACTMSDTDTTNLVGSELVTNGTFEGNATTGWTASSLGTFATSNTQAHSGTYSLHAVANGAGGMAHTNVTVVVGKTYTISAWVYVANSSNQTFKAGTSAGGNQYFEGSAFNTTAWTHVGGTLTATSTTLYLSFTESGSGNDTDMYIDDVSVRLAEKDRSLYAKGFRASGTITKTAVATGAELVGYSGFNSSGNTLIQPINSDILNLEERSFICWSKSTLGSYYQYLWSLTDDTDYHYGLAINASDGKYYTYDQENGAAYTAAGLHSTEWQCIVFTDDESTKKVYINGRNALEVNHAYNLNSSGKDDLRLRVGGYSGNINYHQGSLALLRVSAGILTPDQIKKIYEDEKHLFQTNAKATLYGSSDTVTALAHDDVTKELHVGTSAGRSTFQGLVRTANTTSATEIAISASNGLVAECTDV